MARYMSDYSSYLLPPGPALDGKGGTHNTDQHRDGDEHPRHPDTFSENVKHIHAEDVGRTAYQGDKLGGVLCPYGQIKSEQARHLYER